MLLKCPSWILPPDEARVRLLLATSSLEHYAVKLLVLWIVWVYGLVVWTVIAPIEFTLQFLWRIQTGRAYVLE